MRARLGRSLWRASVLWLAVVAAVVPVGSASSAQRFSWSSPERIDPSDLAAIDCPSMSVCVAGDQEGNVLATTRPSGDAGAWKRVAVPGEFVVGGLSCASVSFCAMMSSGNSGSGLLVSHDPTGPAAAWKFVPVALGASATSLSGLSCVRDTQCTLIGLSESCATTPTHGQFCFPAPPSTLYNVDPATDSVRRVAFLPNVDLQHISCPTLRFCVADGDGVADDGSSVGVVATSSTPSVDGSWKVSAVPNSGFLGPVSCISTAFCIAGDSSGDIVWSVHPARGGSSWHLVRISSSQVVAISCASTSLCAATAAQNGQVFVSTDPTGQSNDWSATTISTAEAYGVSCPSVLLCVAIDDAGNRILGTGPSTSEIKAMLARNIRARHRLRRPTLGSHDGYQLRFSALCAGILSIKDDVSVPVADGHRRRFVVVAQGTRRFSTAGAGVVRVVLTRFGKNLLRQPGHLRIRSRATFTPTGAPAIAVKATLVVYP